MSVPPPPAPRSGRLVFGGILVLLGIAWFLEATSDVAIPWNVVLPGALILIGFVLVVGSRSVASHSGLITLGVILTVVLALGTSFDLSFGGGIGENVQRPTDVTQLRGRYEWAIGEMTIDLSELPELREAGARTELTIDADLGIGKLEVIVPDDAAVRVRGRATMGQVTVFEQDQGGIDVERTFTEPGYETGERRVSLDLTVGMGQVVVRHG